ncbi:hypothetical protein D3C84_724020 [compost metagenome]
MQRTLLQRLQLVQYRCPAVRAQRQRTQVFSLSPDALGGIFRMPVEREHRAHGATRLIDAQLLGERKGALHRGVQF